MSKTDWLAIAIAVCDIAVGLVLGIVAYRYFPEYLQWLF